MPGFWKRPMTRTYSYNLDVGEHYYNPMTSYLEAERGTRGETPGALTYSERLARRWLTGRRYGATDVSDRYVRSSSVARGEAMASACTSEVNMSREARAQSVAASACNTERYNVSAWSNRRELLKSAAHARGLSESSKRAAEAVTANEQLRKQSYVSKAAAASRSASASSSSMQQQRQQSTAVSSSSTAMSASSSSSTSTKKVAQSKSVQQRSSSVSQQQQQQASSSSSQRMESRSRIQDDICKRVADVHMQPWAAGAEQDEAASASARAKARILDLERELDEITRRALSAQTHACKTAAMMAKEAQMEDQQAMSSSYKKSKKVMVESSSKMQRS